MPLELNNINRAVSQKLVSYKTRTFHFLCRCRSSHFQFAILFHKMIMINLCSEYPVLDKKFQIFN